MSEPTQEKQGCLGSLLSLLGRLFGRSSSSIDEFPYKIRADFLSPAELSFYHVLKSVIGPRVAISTKVRLADVLFVRNRKNNMSFFGRISQRHVDFLLCEASSMNPVLVIELDDASHRQSKQILKDQFLNNALEAAGLPILRIRAQRQYSRGEVLSQLTPFFTKAKSQIDSSSVEAPIDSQPGEIGGALPPDCPNCNETMVRRVASRGKNKGSEFYGCVNYPKCKGVLPLKKSQSAG